jgi:hypothetical protein
VSVPKNCGEILQRDSKCGQACRGIKVVTQHP